MKPILLGTISAAALSLGAGSAFAASHSGGMATVTCEQFLALPAADQENQANALKTASGGSSSGAACLRGRAEGPGGLRRPSRAAGDTCQ